MNSEGKLAGRKALVTGAVRGIGHGIALEFARQGADVVLHYHPQDVGAKTAIEEIKAMGRRVIGIAADFNSVQESVRVADEAIEFLGNIDCLVNNAGITLNKPFLKVTHEHFDILFNVNFRAQFFITQRIVSQMIKGNGGAVCNMSSIHALQGAPEHSLYAATKGAITAYTRALGVELAHKGVRVNAIAPGWITVENYFKVIPGFNEKDAAEAASKSVPVARYGLPLDVAKLAVFLCSDDAEFIVGQTIVIDGGTTALMSLISDFREESAARFGMGYVPGI